MVSTNNLVKRYQNVVALNLISLSIGKSCIFGLVGPNGAGKSTLVNILTGLSKKTSGTVNILGYDVSKEGRNIKNKIGVLPETLALFEGLTGEEHLTFISEIYGLKPDVFNSRIKELLSFLDLLSGRNRLIDTYSLGMKKKLSFAAAIIHEPAILFLDEPFENVDPISRRRMKDTLSIMRDNGTTVFITSHALDEVEDFCDEVAILNKGKIVYQSEVKDIRSNIKNEITHETYKSLEEIFIDLTSNEEEKKNFLSWLEHK